MLTAGPLIRLIAQNMNTSGKKRGEMCDRERAVEKEREKYDQNHSAHGMILSSKCNEITLELILRKF